MADHGQSPSTDEEAPQEEQPTQTSDDRLATNLFKDYSSQNQVFIQIFLALAGAGVGYGVDVRDAYAFFSKEKIDIEKLIKNPEYREQVKKYAGHVNFWEKGAVEKGTSKLGAVLDGANRAIKEVDATNEKLVTLKEGLIKDYSTELQNLYGLEKKEIDAIMQRAKYAVRADPNISMQDYVQREAQGYARERLEKEMKKEKLSPEEKEKRIKTSLSETDEKFSRRTSTAGGFEEKNHLDLTINCKQQLNQILTVTPPASVPPPPPTIPASTFLNPITPYLSPLPQMIPSIPIPGGYSLRNVPIPTFGGFKTGLNILGSGFGKLFGGMGSFIGRRGLGRAMNLAGNLGKRAINRALDAFMPGLGMAVGKLNDILKSILGIDVEATIVKGAVILVGGLAVFITVVPIIIGIGVLSHITSDKPMIINTTNEKLGWNEFNKQFLTTEKDDLALRWNEFGKANFIPRSKQISLEIRN